MTISARTGGMCGSRAFLDTFLSRHRVSDSFTRSMRPRRVDSLVEFNFSKPTRLPRNRRYLQVFKPRRTQTTNTPKKPRLRIFCMLPMSEYEVVQKHKTGKTILYKDDRAVKGATTKRKSARRTVKIIGSIDPFRDCLVKNSCACQRDELLPTPKDYSTQQIKSLHNSTLATLQHTTIQYIGNTSNTTPHYEKLPPLFFARSWARDEADPH
mmetsp:Transcript_18629/g.36447  ORF Transcript_18629/g.36447 Transcript_18629/m.36447 type:complete len:211 (+) Transcript_18629:232-864(+)